MKILEINGKKAIAEFLNVQREIRLDAVPHAKVGDHVMVHAGLAISLISSEEALDIQNMWKELGEDVELFI